MVKRISVQGADPIKPSLIGPSPAVSTAKYVAIDANTFVEYDTENRQAQVLFPKELQAELDDRTKQLADLPPAPSDAEQLVWAHENYPPIVEYSARRAGLEQIIANLKAKLEAMQKVGTP